MKISHKKTLTLILILQLISLLNAFNHSIEGNWVKVLFSLGLFIFLFPTSENIDFFKEKIFAVNTSKVKKIHLLGVILIFSSIILSGFV